MSAGAPHPGRRQGARVSYLRKEHHRMSITTPATAPADVNAAFAAERTDQIQAATAQQAAFDARVAAGTLLPLGDGRFQVNDPNSWDNGEILIQQDGQI